MIYYMYCLPFPSLLLSCNNVGGWEREKERGERETERERELQMHYLPNHKI
jgi:hypothetical protein